MGYGQQPKRCSNAEMASFVRRAEPFNNAKGSCYGRLLGAIYVVFSYGEHFPIYIQDELGRWWGNMDKYSTTTTRHQRCANPVARWRYDDASGRRVEDPSAPRLVDTDTMREIVRAGGVGAAATRKLERAIEKAA